MAETRRRSTEGEGGAEAFPEGSPLLFVDDLCAILKLTAGAIRKALHRREFGPYLHIGRRLAVRRESLLATLKAREITPPGATPPPATRPTPDRNFLDKLRKGKTRRTRKGPRKNQDTREDDEDSQSRS